MWSGQRGREQGEDGEWLCYVPFQQPRRLLKTQVRPCHSGSPPARGFTGHSGHGRVLAVGREIPHHRHTVCPAPLSLHPGLLAVPITQWALPLPQGLCTCCFQLEHHLSDTCMASFWLDVTLAARSTLTTPFEMAASHLPRPPRLPVLAFLRS